ncbi:MAG: tail fiber domain-containing protein [Sediminibacterium sp.]|nr:tail fiber domain-containing protein [Sediminibacterium sp.]
MQQNIGMVYKSIITVVFLFCGIFVNAQTGIGTTVPINKLEVVTTAADPASSGATANGNLRLGPNAGSHVLDFGLSSTSTYAWLQARSKSAYGTTYNIAINPNGGNVGIGTTNPTARLNIVGGGVRIHHGFANNSTSRPALNTLNIGNYEIRGVGGGGGATQADGGDDGFLRLSAGGGNSTGTQSSIDLSGYSNVADMLNNIVMRTAGAERLRIDNAGNVGIGTSSPATTLTVGNAGGTISGDITINPSTTQYEGGQITIKKSLVGSTTDWFIDQYGSSAANARLRIFSSSELNGIVIKENGFIGMGNSDPTVRLQVNGDIIANSIAGSSDIRYKTNIRSVENALDKVKSLRGVYFNWNQKAFPSKEFSDKTELGFIAQEVEKVLPEVVMKDKTAEEYRSVKYDKVVALLVEAIKEQQKQIDSLTIKVNKLSKKRNK